MATAKPRLRKSRTVSKYFSIHSVRPGKMQTVPRRPGGGAKRAKRNCTPSGVFSMPVTAPSGTGLAGMETSFMEGRCPQCGAESLLAVGKPLPAQHRLSESPAVLNGGAEILFAVPTDGRDAVSLHSHCNPLKEKNGLPISVGCRPSGCTNRVWPNGRA